MSNIAMDEVRNLQMVVENAKLAERKRCYELTMRLFGNTDNVKELLVLADAIMSGRQVPPIQ